MCVLLTGSSLSSGANTSFRHRGEPLTKRSTTAALVRLHLPLGINWRASVRSAHRLKPQLWCQHLFSSRWPTTTAIGQQRPWLVGFPLGINWRASVHSAHRLKPQLWCQHFLFRSGKNKFPFATRHQLEGFSSQAWRRRLICTESTVAMCQAHILVASASRRGATCQGHVPRARSRSRVGAASDTLLLARGRPALEWSYSKPHMKLSAGQEHQSCQARMSRQIVVSLGQTCACVL